MEDNKLIAEFMGLELEETLNKVMVYARKEQRGLIKLTEFYEANELKFHTSWDWLMPVVRKCFEIDEPTEGQHYFINEALSTMDIEIVYDRVVGFIKEYNQIN